MSLESNDGSWFSLERNGKVKGKEFRSIKKRSSLIENRGCLAFRATGRAHRKAIPGAAPAPRNISLCVLERASVRSGWIRRFLLFNRSQIYVLYTRSMAGLTHGFVLMPLLPGGRSACKLHNISCPMALGDGDFSSTVPLYFNATLFVF